MLLGGSQFKYKKATNYISWGTLREFRNWQRKSVTLFCDFDGCLVVNGSKFGKKGWKTLPIKENLNSLYKLYTSNNLKLIIVTSRPHSELEFIRGILEKFNLKNVDVITDLPHGRRILINDFSNSNPYPTASSINVIRNSKELSEILKNLIN